MRILDRIMANKIRDGDIAAFETLMHKHKTKALHSLHCFMVWALKAGLYLPMKVSLKKKIQLIK